MRLAAVLAIALAQTTTAQAQESAAAADKAAVRADCSGPEYQAFDFWIGNWNVTDRGQFAGTNSITKEYGGCSLREHWQGAEGGYGTSLNAYDRRSQGWTQLWVDDKGGVLKLEGGLQGKAMVLSTHLQGSDGGSTHRISWTPLEDGSVRQLWQSQADGSEQWETVFDGLYVRRENGFPAVE